MTSIAYGDLPRARTRRYATALRLVIVGICPVAAADGGTAVRTRQ